MSDKQDNRRPVRMGKDEMNFAEFPLALIGKRAPANVKTLQFMDETTDRRTGRPVQRKLTISAADVLGLPTAIDDEVILGCLQLSHAQKFASPKVPFERSEFLKLLGWKRSGHHYRRLAESLRRWKGTLIMSENGFWDKGQKRWVNDSFSLLDRVYLAGRGTEESGQDEGCYFVWGDFMWRSIEAGNLRSLDFEFIKSLESGVSKRLYRLLGKRFYYGPTVTFDLKRLAFEKVGFSRKMHTGQIKDKFAASHAELLARGVCSVEYVERCRGQWNVVYTALAEPSPRQQANSQSQSLVKALTQRGVEQAALLVKKIEAARIEGAIENYDDRQAHGQPLSPGWLVKCLTNPQPYEFRRGYQPQAMRTSARKAQQQEAAERKALEVHEQKKSAQLQQRFEKFLAGLESNLARDAYAAAAMGGHSIAAKLYRQRLANCNPAQADSVKREAMFTHWLATNREEVNCTSSLTKSPNCDAA